MIFHVLWVTYILIKENEKLAENFHKSGLFVWGLWLIPVFTGMILKL